MKQYINANQWGTFERGNEKAAAKWRKWLDSKDYPTDLSGCTLYETQPVYMRTTLGRMMEFMQEYYTKKKLDWSILFGRNLMFVVSVHHKTGLIHEPSLRGRTPTNPEGELCDGLWENVMEVLGK